MSLQFLSGVKRRFRMLFFLGVLVVTTNDGTADLNVGTLSFSINFTCVNGEGELIVMFGLLVI